MDNTAKAPSALQIILSTTFRVEFAVGKVVEGKEMWMFGEYFPAIRSTLQEYDHGQLASFAVISANTSGVIPAMGSLNRWPSTDAFGAFHQDPRFTKIRPERDAALDLLTDGHFLAPLDQVLELETQSDYALIISAGNPFDSKPVAELAFAADSPNQTHSGKTLTLHPWTDAARELSNTTPAEAEVKRIRFHPQHG